MIRLVNNLVYGNMYDILSENIEYITNYEDIDLYKYNNMKEHLISWVCLSFAMKEVMNNLSKTSTAEDSVAMILSLNACDEIKATILDFYAGIDLETPEFEEYSIEKKELVKKIHLAKKKYLQ